MSLSQNNCQYSHNSNKKEGNGQSLGHEDHEQNGADELSWQNESIGQDLTQQYGDDAYEIIQNNEDSPLKYRSNGVNKNEESRDKP